MRRHGRLAGHRQVDRRTIGLERVDAQVERGAIEQRRRLFSGQTAVGQRRFEPGRSHPGHGHGLVSRDRRGRVARTVEQRGERGIGLRQQQHRRPATGGHFAAGADRRIGEFAHRAAIAAAGETARAEPVGNQPVGRRAVAARRLDDEIEHLDRRLNAGGRGHISRPLGKGDQPQAGGGAPSSDIRKVT